MDEALRSILRGVSTATLATALFKRGFRRQMLQDVHPLSMPQAAAAWWARPTRCGPSRRGRI